MQTPKIKVKKSIGKEWRRRLLIALAVIVLLPFGLFTIGWLNRDTIIDVLQEWYSDNNNGTLTIGKVNASFLSGFPNIGFTLKDINQTNTDTITDKVSLVNIEEAKVVIGAVDLLSGNIKFKKVEIKDALLLSEVISERSFEYHHQLRLSKQEEEREGLDLPSWLDSSGAEFTLENVIYITKDSILKKYFNLELHNLKGTFKSKDKLLNGSGTMDITVNNLGFNTEKGSFLNGARLSGNPHFNINLEKDVIAIPNFLIDIDKQTFNLKADFDVSDTNNYVLQLNNENTDFEAIKGLLTDKIRSKLDPYKIIEPFTSELKLAGKFSYGNNPNIEATFSTNANEVIIVDNINLENTSFSGYLTNDIYATDSLRLEHKSPKDLRLYFDEIKGNVEDIVVNINDAYYQSTPDALNYINAKLSIEGSNETLARIVDTDNFDFNGGNFLLNATIDGDVSKPNQFLNKAVGDFKLSDTRVVLKKNGLQLPVKNIEISLEEEQSILKQLKVNLPNGEQMIFKGRLKNISGLLSKNPTVPTTSEIFLNSRDLNINEIISMATEFAPNSNSEIEDRKNLHETLDAIFDQFHPEFNLNVSSLQYNDVTINDVKANIELSNSETISLKNFTFNYDDATTSLTGTVVVPQPKSQLRDPIYINAKANSHGPIEVFKRLFNIQLFRIESGDYNFTGNVTGNVQKFSQLLQSAEGDLELSKAKLYYPSADLTVEFDSLALVVDNSDIILKKFNVEIGELYPINLTGKIEQFPGILLDDLENTGSVSLTIDAPYIDGDKLLGTINSLKNDEIKSQKTGSKLHTVFKDLYEFDPDITLIVDSLKYKDLITKDLNAKAFFENDSIIRLNHLDINYKETVANIKGEINAHSSKQALANENPFDFEFTVKVEGNTMDLNDYLKTTNFIFKSGKFAFNGNYDGQSQAFDILNTNAFGNLKIEDALVDYSAADLQIPIDNLQIEINNNLAILKTLDINLPGKSSIEFSGSIDDFSGFVNNTEDYRLHKSDFSIYAPYLDSDDIKEFLETSKPNKDKEVDKDLNLKKFKDAMVEINNSFYPTISIDIDTLKHKDFKLTDFGLNLLFDKDGDFIVEDTQLNFYGGSILMNIEVEVANEVDVPVKFEMKATDVDIHELVTRFDYFNDDDLRQAEKIEGNLNFKIDASGSLKHDGKLNMASVNGTFEVDISNLALHNYKPIMENSVMLKDERFKNLEFRPIVQTFLIKNGEIIIPRTEIQSTAIHAFVEGKLKLNEYINIWLSLPWKNLKKNDGLTLPEKTTYKKAGAKFYVQLLQDKTSEKPKEQKLKVKVRLSNRKLRKELKKSK